MVNPEVTIEQGTLRGSVAENIRGNKFFKFQGIPYAKPPLGKLRFKAPQPPEKWSGILNATKEGDVCYSRNPLKDDEVAGSENCLFLNVYTTKISSLHQHELKPVLFWIHGGGFIWGSGNEEYYGPDFLITEDVVLVTINYRLGLLGFLSFENPSLEIPGNTGFKDQVLALKWVQKNIAKFGGDPNNVTIFGESAGSVSAQLLMLSPMGKGLFHKAIAQSGCAARLDAKNSTDIKLLASVMGIQDLDEKTVYNTLMKKSTEEILEIQEKFSSSGGKVGLVFEKNSEEPFLDKEPMEIILSGRFNHVPLIIGYNSREALFFIPPIKPGELTPVNFEDYIPQHFGYKSGTPELKAVAKKLEKFYFGPEGYNEKTAGRIYEFVTDGLFVYSTQDGVLTQYKISKAPTYLYRMSLDTKLNFYKNLKNLDQPGASHMDDLGYLFKNYTTPEIKRGSVEHVAVSRFVKLWINFAKYGNPTPERHDYLLKAVWKPVTEPNLDFLDIGKDLVASTDPDGDRMNFWRRVYSESPAGKNEKGSK